MGVPKDEWRRGTEPITFRLAKTQMEQIEFLMKETHRSKANTVQVLVEERLEQVMAERQQPPSRWAK